ncbi:DNA-processing protein DprA [Caldisalinibacter kiritimatiensis]|uniref:Rossmann fold nucleotide-binding protein Smf possibly involved in DNA uptake n=1 Tax=Caldisalinibacter kiritimatiensis TaxID=1304284 RepID=R1CEM0_9FIRM|nr:DNA-processing protein DprA [Caldisalinibacter kiritimatiensis]EOD00750.1 Rossmann fold nucleotide-binding protein Smf possibly involved in DNA uptake [Caldisalinibacter kiritimatiensis]
MYKQIYIKLSQIEGIGRKSMLLFRGYIKDNNIKMNTLDNTDIIEVYRNIKSIDKRIKVPTIDELKVADEKSNKIIDDCIKNKIKITTIEDKNYPNEFREIDAPPILYYSRGNHNLLLHDKKIAIIGTRYPTNRGKKYAYDIAQYFTNRDYVIVSGLANGCDTYGHRGCVENNGKTIVTLPSDVLNIYPKENMQLAEKIIENDGCIISEYPVKTQIKGYQFIERDRLQAALSKVVIVIETDVDSGTMHTVKFTRKYKKRLACLTFPKSLEKYKVVQGNKILLKNKNVIKISNFSDLKDIEEVYE